MVGPSSGGGEDEVSDSSPSFSLIIMIASYDGQS